MGNLFVVYGDILSEKLLFFADVLAVPAYGGWMSPQDELTHRLFESVNGPCLQRAIEEKYGDERMKYGEVRPISGFSYIETLLFVNALDEPLWSLERDPEIEKRLIVGYHNAVTVAMLMGHKSILLPYFGMSLSDSENEYMIKRITRTLRKELSERRRGMDIYHKAASLSLGNPNAINLGFGQSPMRYRRLVFCLAGTVQSIRRKCSTLNDATVQLVRLRCSILSAIFI